MKQPELKIVKFKRSFLIVSGKSELWKGRTHQSAISYLMNNLKLLQYWAGSASVAIDNSKWIELHVA